MKKAQIAMEFMFVVGLAMVVILVFIGGIHHLTYNYSEEKNINRLIDLGYSLQSEIILASEIEIGYERTIIIPDKIQGIDYSLSQTANDIVITYRGGELLFSIPKVTGTLNKGSNTIRKINATSVKIN